MIQVSRQFKNPTFRYHLIIWGYALVSLILILIGTYMYQFYFRGFIIFIGVILTMLSLLLLNLNKPYNTT
ncbi:MAG: hypothetical protein ACTSWE_06695 [Promethearchaeota archaeon]